MIPVDSDPKLIVQGYQEFVEEKIQEGWTPYVLTIMFNQINGSPTTVLTRMGKEWNVSMRRCLLGSSEIPLQQVPTDSFQFGLGVLISRFLRTLDKALPRAASMMGFMFTQKPLSHLDPD